MAEGEFQNGSGDAAEEDRLLDAVLAGIPEVRQETPVQDRFDLLDSVFLRLARRELLFEIADRVVPRKNTVRRVDFLVLAFLDVCVDDVRHLGRGDDRDVDVLVFLHAQGLHEDDQRNLAGRRRDGHNELPVLLLLHQGEGAVPFFLREHLRDLDLAAVPLVELHEDAVRGEVLQGDQAALRPPDDEVSAGIVRILAHLDELALVLVDGEFTLRLHVLLVEETPFRLHHDREVPDVDPLRLPLDAVLDDREVQVDRRRVVQVPQARFHRGEGMRRAVRFLDDGQTERDGRLRLEVDSAAVVPLPPNPDLDDVPLRPILVELDDAPSFVLRGRAEIVDDALLPRVRVVDRRKEVVERRDVMVHNRAFSEERINQVSHGLPPDDQPVCLAHACGPAHPDHADDATFVDRALHLLQHLDHGVRLPDLRKLVLRDLQGLENSLRLFLRDEPMLWYELMLQHVKPQGRSSLGALVSPGMSFATSRTGPRGLSGTPRGSQGPFEPRTTRFLSTPRCRESS